MSEPGQWWADRLKARIAELEAEVERLKQRRPIDDYCALRGDHIQVELMYPGCDIPDRPEFVHVGMCHVRAADDLRISYDFERDGWKIEQAKYFSWGDEDDGTCDPGWEEVAFCQAWQKEVKRPWDEQEEP